ncbi:probable myosin-binding protein 6 isoform X2 [Malania oleifera]|nr:probable myosin-binding protein 6 isoform X2 [Malania oleifera]
MALHAVHSWTLGALVGAFLDLVAAYILLSVSIFAFIASEILGLFGVCLPCIFNEVFGFWDGGISLLELLFDWPRQKISTVQATAKSRFPFSSMCVKNDEFCHMNVKLIEDRSSSTDCGAVEFEGEVSEQSFGHGNFFSKHSLGRMRYRAPASFVPVDGGDGFHDIRNTPTCASTQQIMKLSGTISDVEAVDKDSSSAKGFVKNPQDRMGISQNKVNAIRELEQALEEEKVFCAALSIELEKERAAAATAAEEAMAMILRLQKEKASIEMEARQYQRIIDEKSAYDEEEMNILKELLFIRDREKHILERQVDAYRQMTFLGNEQVGDDMHDMEINWGQMLASSHYLNEEPLLLQQQIDESISDKEMGENILCSSNNEALHVQKQSPSWNLHGDIVKQINLEKKVGEGGDQIGSNLHGCKVDTALNVHENKPILADEGSAKESGSSVCAALGGSRNCAPSTGVSCASCGRILSDFPGMGMPETEHGIHRNNSNVSSGSLVIVNSPGQTLSVDPGWTCTPAVSDERMKIEAEIESFRGRLHEVHEGRDKYSFSSEHLQVEKMLKLLVEITDELKVIRQLTGPRKAVQPASLPRPPSK